MESTYGSGKYCRDAPADLTAVRQALAMKPQLWELVPLK